MGEWVHVVHAFWRRCCRIMALLTKGFPTACLLSNKHLLVHQKALKALHTLFDMEVSAAAMAKVTSGVMYAILQPC